MAALQEPHGPSLSTVEFQSRPCSKAQATLSTVYGVSSPEKKASHLSSSRETTTEKTSSHLSADFSRELWVETSSQTFDKNTISSLLQEDISLREGELLHAHIAQNGFDQDLFLANLLISLYGKFGLLDEACWVFDRIPYHTVVSWSALISAYTEYGYAKKAITLFQEMRQAGLKPNEIIFVRILTACAKECALEDGRSTHALLIEHGVIIDIVLGTALLTMYGKCSDLEAARWVFNSMSEHDTISWNAMLAVFQHNQDNIGAGLLFELMQEREIQPSKSTFLSALASYASAENIEKARFIHEYILKIGLDSDVEVANGLIYIYGMCGALEEAECVFEHTQHGDVVSWNSMIAAYARGGCFREAYGLFRKMLSEHREPTRATYLNMLSACTGPDALSVGNSIHVHISQSRFDSDVPVATALIYFYGKCGAVEDARKVFDNIDRPDTICWNAMIACYTQQGQSMQALKLFQKMLQIGLNPDKITLSCILSACADAEYLLGGKLIHAYIVENDFDSNIVIVQALIHMYGSCGNLDESRALFDNLKLKGLVSWNTMITAYAQQGRGMQAIELYEQMLGESVKPDEVTFVSLLSACSHAGLVDQGYNYFVSMSELHNLTPLLEHYICLIDLFGRAGWLDAAEYFIQVMPYKATSSVWSTLLNGCRLHKNLKRANCAVEKLLALETITDTYAVLSYL